MHVVEQRYRRLKEASIRRRLSQEEIRELCESEKWLDNRRWLKANLLDRMKFARKTRDWDWFWESANEYDELEGR